MSPTLVVVLRKFVLPAVLAVLAPLAMQGAIVQAQELRMNNSCPSVDDPALPTMNKTELLERCPLGKKPVGEVPVVTAVDCKTVRTLAAYARLNNSDSVEAQAAVQVAAEHCPTEGDATETIGDQGIGFPVGFFEFERGYFTRYSGKKAETCRNKYMGTARITSAGVISFTSGGHDWSGVVDQNGVMVIRHDGVTNPVPINATAIIGPLEDAELYNGYCGYGYFRLLGRM